MPNDGSMYESYCNSMGEHFQAYDTTTWNHIFDSKNMLSKIDTNSIEIISEENHFVCKTF